MTYPIDEIEVTMTPEALENGKPGHSCYCPVAMLLNEKLPEHPRLGPVFAEVDPHNLNNGDFYLIAQGDSYDAENQDELIEFLGEYDRKELSMDELKKKWVGHVFRFTRVN